VQLGVILAAYICLARFVTYSFFFPELDADWLAEVSGVQPYKLGTN
jgi:hypothetical protein